MKSLQITYEGSIIGDSNIKIRLKEERFSKNAFF